MVLVSKTKEFGLWTVRSRELINLHSRKATIAIGESVRGGQERITKPLRILMLLSRVHSV